MKDSLDTARRWVDFIAARPEFARGDALRAQFRHAVLTNFCECGCRSFDADIPGDSGTEPIAPPADRGGPVFILEFRTRNPAGTLEFVVYADRLGNLEGMDVTFNGNSDAVPERFEIEEPPYQVYGSLARDA